MSTADTLHLARQHHQAGNLEMAERLYEQVLAGEPDNAEVLYLLGLVDRQRGRLEAAVDRFSRAAAIEPRKPVFLYAWGNALLARNEPGPAAARYRRALELHPGFADAHANLGLALAAQGRHDDAIRSCRSALEIDPRHVVALINLGNAQRAKGDLDQAAGTFHQALQIAPDLPQAMNNLGNVRLSQGRIDEAIKLFEEALAVDPSYAEAHSNLGTACQAIEDRGRAIRCFEKASALAPGDPTIQVNLGHVLAAEGRTREAIEHYERGLTIDASHVEARFHARLTLPVLYDTPGEIDRWRQRFTTGLGALAREIPRDTREECLTAARGVGSLTNFYLAYQAQDDRPLQEQYGRLAHAIMAGAHPTWSRPRTGGRRRRSGGRIRVGWASCYLRFHAVGRLMLGFLRHADRSRLQHFVYDTGGPPDAVTEAYRAACDEFRHVGGDLEGAAERIAADRLDVLVYPDVGMEPRTTQMALLRLAPVQCASWGHPVTTGLPTIDWFISAQGMEPPEAPGHYSEKLRMLPGVGVAYERPAFPAAPKSRRDLGFGERDVVYLCAQALYKYLPQHDRLLAAIAAKVPAARFAFLSARSEAITQRFRQRLSRAFDDGGADAGRIVTLPRLDPHTDYLALHLAADVCLDTPDWSGGNTTFEALAAGRPVVTWPGRFMRGRHACAMLRQMGVETTIAASTDQYVEIAVRLGLDRAERAAVAAAVAERSGLVFDDPLPVRALEAFFAEVVE